MSEKEKKDVVVVEESKAIDGFISDAIAKELPVETMEKLFSLRSKFKAEFAREEFMKAMANFQKDCPVIEKKKIVNDKFGKERYRYASLDDIVSQVKVPLGDNSLSYSFETDEAEGFLKVICVITHSLGHSKSSDFKIPIGTEAYMSDVQKYGARVTFAKRYAFTNALGIMTGDEDNDATEETEEKPSGKLLTLDDITAIKKPTTEAELKKYYNENKEKYEKKGLKAEFANACGKQKLFIEKVKKDEQNENA